MRIRDGEKGIFSWREHDSVEAMIGEIKLHAGNKDHHNARLFDGGMDNARFYSSIGITSVPAFKKMFEAGWKDGAAKMANSVKALGVQRVRSVRRRAAWRDEGDELSMDRVMAGQLDTAWRTTARTLVDGQSAPYVRIVVQMAATAAKRADEFFWRGAAACVMADALEEAGYRTEISGYAYSDSVYGHQSNMEVIKLKAFDEQLDTARLAAVTAEASGFRVLCFAARLSHRAGTSCAMGTSIYDRPSEILGVGDIWVGNVWNTTEATELVSTELSKFGE